MGVQPACGDFHAQMNLGGLIGKSLDRGAGAHSPGTLQYLKLVIKRKSADGNWKRSFSANERFLKDSVAVHAVGFALRHWGMSSVHGKPTVTKFNQSLPTLPSEEDWDIMTHTTRKEWLNKHLDKIVNDIWAFSIIDPNVTAPSKARRPPQKARFSCECIKKVTFTKSSRNTSRRRNALQSRHSTMTLMVCMSMLSDI